MCVINTAFEIFILLILLFKVKSIGDVNIRQYDLDSSPKDLVWCGTNKEYVLVLTDLHSLYQSEDKGFSWKKLNDILTNTGKDQLEENENEIGKISRILQSPVDKHLLIFLGTHGINWIGENCGKKLNALNHGRRIKEFVFHPTERNWGLASAYTLCDDFVGEPCKIYKELFVTKDLGQTWNLIGSYIVEFNWGIIDESHIQAGIPKERILVAYEPRAKGDQVNIGWNYKIDFIYSDDFFKTKKTAVYKGNKFMLTKNYLFVAQVVDQESQEVMLLVSNSRKVNYEFETIETNQKKFNEHSYTFLDTSEGSVFLHINHLGEVSKYGHIYISDAQGLHFSLSLKYNLRSTENQCDFEKIDSLEGVYIANVISLSYMRNGEEEIEADEINDQESMEGNRLRKSLHSKTNSGEFQNFIKSLISFNKGGNWRRITAPKRNREGHLYDCGEYCYLNLHGITSDFPPFYSAQSAAGIILGNGNVGRYLNHNVDEASTFLSRDGGLNWFEIRKGPHIYEIGDHGALILIADERNPTNSIFYSWDEGLTFEELKISSEKIMVKNIIIEPTSTSQHFVLYGETQTKKGIKKGVIIGLDFSSLHEPQCRNPENPDTSDSDYEKWTPNDGRGGKECLLGRKVTYIRKKREAQCYNGFLMEKKVIVENCLCTEEDYECDTGFGREAPGDPCISTFKLPFPLPFEVHPVPEDCNGSYIISKGYRKIPGNSCINGVKFDPLLIPCPIMGQFSKLTFSLLILLVIILLVLIAIVFNTNFYTSIAEVIKYKLNSSDHQQKEKYINIDTHDEEESQNFGDRNETPK